MTPSATTGLNTPLSRTESGTWTITTTAGYTATGHLPLWADEDPSATGVPHDRLSVTLADIRHHITFEGQQVAVWNPALPSGRQYKSEQAQVLWGSIECHPYAEAPQPREPVVNIAIVADHWISGLDPDGVAEIARQLRAQADRLDNEIRPRLVAARADWAEHHPA